MTAKGAAETLRAILKECTSSKRAVAHVTCEDSYALVMAIEALNRLENMEYSSIRAKEMNLREPSQKQVNYADAISWTLKIPLPEVYSMEAYRTFIAENKKKYDEKIAEISIYDDIDDEELMEYNSEFERLGG